MAFLQWINDKKTVTEIESGADFGMAIQAIQSVSQGFVELKKTSPEKIQKILQSFLEAITNHPDSIHYTSHEWQVFCERLKDVVESPTPRPLPIGPAFIFISRSSTLLRFLTVAQALRQGCTALLLCSPQSQDSALCLIETLMSCGLPSKSLALLTSSEPEVLETLIHHPSLKSLHFQGHFYEGDFLRKSQLPLFQKRIKIHFGGKNPVIWTYDAPMDSLKEILKQSLVTRDLSEQTFHRWFVQEKNYALFIEKIETALQEIDNDSTLWTPKDSLFEAHRAQQNTVLLKEKNWRIPSFKNFAFNPDFNNCSPWHQQETLGPVLTVTRFKNAAEAIKFSNTTAYASAAIVFSSSIEKSKEITSQLTMPHLFENQFADLGRLKNIRGLSGCGLGLEWNDEAFFSYTATV